MRTLIAIGCIAAVLLAPIVACAGITVLSLAVRPANVVALRRTFEARGAQPLSLRTLALFRAPPDRRA